MAGDYAAGAPAALGGRRVVPPLLLDIPGRVYERPADAATSERSRWGAASARCSEATPCVPAISSCLVGFVFVFGNNIRNLYESVIFLFIVHPCARPPAPCRPA